MIAFSTVSLCTSALPPQNRNPKTSSYFSSSSRSNFLFLNSPSPILTFLLRHRRTVPLAISDHRSEDPPPPSSLPTASVSIASIVAASVLLFIRLFGFPSCPAAVAAGAARPLPAASARDDSVRTDATSENVEGVEGDEEFEAAFNAWKSKTFALSVPLRIVALHGSVPPSWIKVAPTAVALIFWSRFSDLKINCDDMQDFTQSQSKRLKFNTKFLTSLENIFSDLSVPMNKGKVDSKSVVAADVVGVGDSWLSYAIKRSMIEPMRGVEDQDWFKGLSEKWKVYVRRNSQGELDPKGEIWAAPYRWGGLVIAYKISKFQQHKLAPIEDWADLWRPELAGKIAMVDSPREVIGAVLKYMGASYNTKDIDSQIPGGRNAVLQNLASLGKQVRLFDSTYHLKAFGVGDVWVAVGWSSDVLPVAKRMSNVAVIVPKSGTSLWADLWAIPSISGLEANEKLGGRVRGPSPLVHQWIEFCLQYERALPFKQEVIPGSIPSALESSSHAEIVPKELIKGKPKMETNLIDGSPPLEVLSKSEFLEPLSEAAALDYKWLISNMQRNDNGPLGLIQRLQGYMYSAVQTLGITKKQQESESK
ncbi:Spermidine-binding periplasmic protein SpuE [Linum perenne]